MADVIANGISVSPGSGSGNTQLKLKASPTAPGNRVAKVQKFNVVATGAATPASFTATLVPKPEFVSFDNLNPSVPKGGGNITLTGKSNSSKLTFTKGTGSIVTADITAVKYTAAGVSTANGSAIAGDPGADAQYEFSIVLTAAANTTVSERSQQITVTGAGGSGVVATLTLKQTAGDPTISVSPTAINVPQSGEVSVQVTTNTTFTVQEA